MSNMIFRALSQYVPLAVMFLFQDGCLAMAPPPGLGHPYEKPNNMTIDEAILDTLGGIDVATNVMLEEGSNILAELDMYLTMDQFNNMYEPPKPEDMVKMGIMPAPLGAAKGDPRYSFDMPPDFKLQDDHQRKKRKAAGTARPWTNSEVPYLFAKGHFTAEEEYMMRRSMTEWERYTCMKFRPATESDSNSLRFQNGQGCNSQLGMRKGVQVLNLQSPGCRYKGLYLHEIGHALGLVHEHQLPDRDNYIRILYHNVSPHMRIWFNKYKEDELKRMKVPYELSSVMHYGITAFSRDGESQTIQALDKAQEERIGRVYLKELAFTDVAIVNKFYRCAEHCPDQNKCGHDGHLDQNCNCICRDGSTDCDQTKQATDPSCKNTYYDWPCYIWANQGECERNAFYMNRDCAKACRKCLGDSTGSQGQCKDLYSESKCKMWKERGDCVTNTMWMKKHCGSTCKMCGTGDRPEEACQNKNTDGDKCTRWAKDGECIVNKGWMFENCRKSCHMCTDTGTDGGDTGDGFDEDDMKCENKHNNCESWASKGECTNNPGWMVANCRKACDKCDDGNCKNLYVDVRCEIWAQKKECMANSKWMGKYCSKSCASGPCKGIHPNSSTTAGPGVSTPRTTKAGGRTTRPTTTTDGTGSCVNIHNSDTQCDVWAKADHCDINPSWMLKNCARSCGLFGNSDKCGGGDRTKSTSTTEATGDKTNVCHDDNTLCRVWAENGHCDGDSSVFMLKNCKKSCNNCNGCRDAEFTCSIWAKADHCLQNPRYMMRHCQKSCHACTISRDPVDRRQPDYNTGSRQQMGTLLGTIFVIFMYLFIK